MTRQAVGGGKSAGSTHAERRAAELRANLARRKQQARERARQQGTGESPAAVSDGKRHAETDATHTPVREHD